MAQEQDQIQTPVPAGERPPRRMSKLVKISVIAVTIKQLPEYSSASAVWVGRTVSSACDWDVPADVFMNIVQTTQTRMATIITVPAQVMKLYAARKMPYGASSCGVIRLPSPSRGACAREPKGSRQSGGF